MALEDKVKKIIDGYGDSISGRTEAISEILSDIGSFAYANELEALTLLCLKEGIAVEKISALIENIHKETPNVDSFEKALEQSVPVHIMGKLSGREGLLNLAPLDAKAIQEIEEQANSQTYRLTSPKKELDYQQFRTFGMLCVANRVPLNDATDLMNSLQENIQGGASLEDAIENLSGIQDTAKNNICSLIKTPPQIEVLKKTAEIKDCIVNTANTELETYEAIKRKPALYSFAIECLMDNTMTMDDCKVATGCVAEGLGDVGKTLPHVLNNFPDILKHRNQREAAAAERKGEGRQGTTTTKTELPDGCLSFVAKIFARRAGYNEVVQRH